MIKAVGSRGVAPEVCWACAKALCNLVQALSLRRPEFPDHDHRSQVNCSW